MYFFKLKERICYKMLALAAILTINHSNYNVPLPILHKILKFRLFSKYMNGNFKFCIFTISLVNMSDLKFARICECGKEQNVYRGSFAK